MESREGMFKTLMVDVKREGEQEGKHGVILRGEGKRYTRNRRKRRNSLE